MLGRPLDRREPALAPLHPDLGFRLQLEGRLVQSSEPNLDERVAWPDRIEQSRPTARAEAASFVARDLTAHLEGLDGPLPVHDERAPGLLSAVRAVAAPHVDGRTPHAVADSPAEAAAGAYWLQLYAQGRRPHVGGRSRRNHSTVAYACLQSEVSSATLAPYRAASSDAG